MLCFKYNKRGTAMDIRTVRRPGEKGTQELVKKYGERLVCIRYRYDPARKKRYKTVELIVAEQDWRPPEPHPQETRATGFTPKRFHTPRVGIRIGFEETELRKQIKAAGGVGFLGTLVVPAGRAGPKARVGAEGCKKVMVIVRVLRGTICRNRVLVGTRYYSV